MLHLSEMPYFQALSPFSIFSNTQFTAQKTIQPNIISYLYHFLNHLLTNFLFKVTVQPYKSKRIFELARYIICNLLSFSLNYFNHLFNVLASLSISRGLAICSFIPTVFAACTSSANAFAVIAMIGIFLQ